MCVRTAEELKIKFRATDRTFDLNCEHDQNTAD